MGFPPPIGAGRARTDDRISDFRDPAQLPDLFDCPIEMRWLVYRKTAPVDR